jgi:glutaminase
LFRIVVERLVANAGLRRLSRSGIQDLIDSVRREAEPRLGEGRLADYIPELAKVDPNKLGIAVATVDGDLISCGDAQEPFSIQSISKVFMLTLALGKVGDVLWNRVGREPSGTPFDSIVQLEHEKGRPRNPFINAGAIIVTDAVLAGHAPREAIGEILQFIRFLANDDSIAIDPVRGPLRNGVWLPQSSFGELHAGVRHAHAPGGPRSLRLFPPMRHRHELLSAGPSGPVSSQ